MAEDFIFDISVLLEIALWIKQFSASMGDSQRHFMITFYNIGLSEILVGTGNLCSVKLAARYLVSARGRSTS